MIVRLLVLCLLISATDGWAAVTYPTLPRSLPDIRVASSLRTIAIGTSSPGADFTAYLANTDTNLCSGSPCGGMQYGDRIELPAGFTTSTTTTFFIPKPTGDPVGVGGDNYVTITSGSGATCPSDGTQVIGPNDPLGRTANIANLAKVTTTGTSAGHIVFKQTGDGIDHIRIICLEFDAPSTLSYNGLLSFRADTQPPDTLSSMYPSYISIERNYFKNTYDFGSLKTLTVEGAHIQIKDNNVIHAMSATSGDANGILFYCGAGPFLIQNNSVGGMGENIFFGGGPMTACPVVTEGYEYDIPKDITVKYNTLYRLDKYKSDHADYEPPAETDGTGTVSSSGTTITFSTSQTGLTGKFIRGATSLAMGKVTSGSGTTWTVTWMSGVTGFTGSENWRYNTRDLGSKNCMESKGSRYVEVAYNICYNFWKAGQFYDITLTPREFGWFSDWTVHHNLFYRTDGPALMGVGDYEGGAGFGPSPYPTRRMWIHNNLWHSVVTTSYHGGTLATNPFYAGVIGGFLGTMFGQIATQVDAATSAGTSGTISSLGTTLTFSASQTGLTGTCIMNSSTRQTVKVASGSGTSWVSDSAFSPAMSSGTWYIAACVSMGATTGNNVTVTATGGSVFGSDQVGDGTNVCLVYNGYTSTDNGRATVKSFTSGTSIKVDITSAFPDTKAHTPSWFAIGKCDIVGTMYHQGDSWIEEHNGWAPITSEYKAPWTMSGYQSSLAQAKATNVIFRSNYAAHGFATAGGVGGFYGDGAGGGGDGSAAFFGYVDSATAIVGNNVLWGAETLTASNNSQAKYTGAMASCKGPDDFSTCKTAFHDPDWSGGGGSPASGSVGFTDPANGDFHVTGTYATAAHDGTQIGPDLTELYRRTAYAFRGAPYNSAGASAVSGSSGAHAIAGSSGATVGSGGCMRGLAAVFDSGC